MKNNYTILPNPIHPDTRRAGRGKRNSNGNDAPHKPCNVRYQLRAHACIVPSGYGRTLEIHPSSFANYLP